VTAALLILVRVLVVLFLVRLALRLVARFLRPAAVNPGPARTGVDMVRDRVCNTFVPRERALHAVLHGREEHFCSSACRDRALAAGSAR
jgi:hypothetical protein